MKIGIVGLGLIGGSMAKSIKKYTDHEILGWDMSADVLKSAQEQGVIDRIMNEGKPSECEMVLVALYPKAVSEYIDENWNNFGEGCLVVDCAGTKTSVCETVKRLTEEKGRNFEFVGGHPMAGIAKSGYKFSDSGIFDKAAMLLTPFEDTPGRVMSVLHDFFTGIGFREIHVSSPAEHDCAIAYTSQLAHIISSAYAARGLKEEQWDFAAGSFRDLTRVAILKQNMWAELFVDNKAFLLEEVEQVINRLVEFRDALDKSDCKELERLLTIGKEKRLEIADDKVFE